MLATKFLFLCFYLSTSNVEFIFGNPIGEKYKLELVQTLFRHGARTPIDCEAKFSPYHNESLYEPWGYSQLTNEGMTDEYRIGEMLRNRYKDFLPDLYKPNDVYAYSSTTDRTKASLQLVLAALYPPTGDLLWNKNLTWIPIPIHTHPRQLDILMKPRNCPKFAQTLEQLFNTSEIKQAALEHSKIFQLLTNIYEEEFDFGKLFCAYSLIVVHKNLNLPLPEWYTDQVFTEMSKASKFHFDTLSYTPTLNRFNGGTMIKRFVENIEKSNLKSNRKIYLYSGHDKTVYAFMKAHGIEPHKLPDYGTALILEKLRDENNELYVRLLLWSGRPKKLDVLKLKTCTEICPLKKYLNIVNPILPSDEEMRCLFQNLQPYQIENILNSDETNIIK